MDNLINKALLQKPNSPDQVRFATRSNRHRIRSIAVSAGRAKSPFYSIKSLILKKYVNRKLVNFTSPKLSIVCYFFSHPHGVKYPGDNLILKQFDRLNSL